MNNFSKCIFLSILVLPFFCLTAQKITSNSKVSISTYDGDKVSIKNDELISVTDRKENRFECDLPFMKSFNQKSDQLKKDLENPEAVIQTTITTENNYYKSHCVVTEQSGNNTGKLWVVAVIESNPIGADKIGIYTYEPTGWDLKTYVYTFKNLGSTLDAEIIETTAGEKAIWITTDYEEAVSNKSKVLVIGLNLNNLAEGSITELNWPGGSDNGYYNPRMTSDNGFYGDSPWIYIVASVDSITTTSKHVNGQKFAYITNPWVPLVSELHYRPNFLPVFWPDGGTTEIHILYSDIAYIRTSANENKLIFTYSNVPDETKIWLSSSSIAGNNAQFMGTINPSISGSKIRNSVISSPGGTQSQMMVAFEENYNNTGDYDLYSAKSTDDGVTWEMNQIDISNTTANLGKLVSRRSVTDEYYLSYLSTGDSNSVMSIKTNSNTGHYWDDALKVNDTNPSFNNNNSSIGFTNTAGERVTVWSRFDQPLTMPLLLIGSFWPNLPTSVNEKGKYQLTAFQLNQNYPNPFNPITKISWQAPISSHQTLKVYDLLGKEVTALVDEYLPAGSYEVEFNANQLSSGVYFYKLQAGSFIETKKMVLIR